MATCRKSCLVPVMLLFSVVALSAASIGENRAYSAAEKSFKDGIWWRAETEFAGFIKEFPDSERRPEAFLLQAQAMFHQTNAAGTLSLLTANLGVAGKFADEYQFWMAEAYYQRGDFAKAAEAYVELRRFAASPRRIEAMVGEAAAHAALTNWTRVVAVLGGPESEFTQSILNQATNPRAVPGLLLLGEAQLELKNYPAVETALAPLAGRQLGGPLDWRAERLRYLARFAQAQWPGALAASSNLLVLATNVPSNRAAVLSESVVLRADALERSGLRAEARAVLEKNLTPGTPANRQEYALLKITELALSEGRLAAANDTLARFLDLSSNSPAAATALLSLGEIHLRQAAGYFSTNAATPSVEATNHLNTALGLFDRLLAAYTNSPLVGHAELNRGWSFWLKGQLSDSAAAFERAAQKLGDGEDLVVARFKLGDALFAQTNFARALPAYQSAVEASARWPQTRAELGADLFHQVLRSSLEVTNVTEATNAMAQIMTLQPRTAVADGSLLQLVQKLADVGQPELAWSEYEKFIALAPDFSRRAEIELLLGRAREQQGDWAAAIVVYERWLTQFSTNALRPQVEYQLAWANSRAGFETNALQQFNDFAARYATNDLERAPQAQWWVADWYFDRSLFPKAEENYKVIFQTWPQSWLARDAILMAGRAALEGARIGDAISYFTILTSEPTPPCPEDLKVRALFHYGAALMAQPAIGTNRLENFDEAIRVFNVIQQSYPTNEMAVLAWVEKARCWMQQGALGFTNAWLAFSQVITSAVANVTARSEAQVGRGQLLEAATQGVSGPERTVLLRQALEDYLDVVYEKNLLYEGEKRDSFWVKTAGVAAGRVLETLGEWEQAEKLYVRLQGLLPPQRASLQRKIEQARERRQAEKNGSGI